VKPRALDLVPVTLADAHAFVAQHHRHHRAAQGGLFAVGCASGVDIVGVAVVGRPVARRLNDGFTAEVVRLCCLEGFANCCSKLYGAAWRACRALGYRRCVTYTLASESGSSLLGAGWQLVGEVRGGTWSRTSRPRVDRHPTQSKLRWEATA
jgi:hypothetical protein